MTKSKKIFGLCDVCGWRYKLSELKYNSYGLRVCPTDYDGKYDNKNHPQNYSAKIKPEEAQVRNPRPDPNNDRALNWEDASITWEELDAKWNTVTKGDL